MASIPFLGLEADGTWQALPAVVFPNSRFYTPERLPRNTFWLQKSAERFGNFSREKLWMEQVRQQCYAICEARTWTRKIAIGVDREDAPLFYGGQGTPPRGEAGRG